MSEILFICLQPLLQQQQIEHEPGPIDIRKTKNHVQPLQWKINEFIQEQQNDPSNNDRLTIDLNISSCCSNSQSQYYPTVCSGEQACESVSVVVETLDTTTTPVASNIRVETITTTATKTTQSSTDITSTTSAGGYSLMDDSGSTIRNTSSTNSTIPKSTW